jgi:hypothetical protein
MCIKELRTDVRFGEAVVSASGSQLASLGTAVVLNPLLKGYRENHMALFGEGRRDWASDEQVMLRGAPA